MFKNFASSVSVKMFLVAFLILILQIPLHMVIEVADERKERNQEVQSEISSKWGGMQSLSGPLLQFRLTKSLGVDKKGEKRFSHSNFILLPEELQVLADVQSFPKKRGIYTAVLYNSKVTFTGYFSRARLSQAVYGGNLSNLRMGLSLSDTRGLDFDSVSEFNGKKLDFVPGSGIERFNRGIHSAVDVSGGDEKIPFRIEIRFTGSSSLFFSPTAKRTEVKITSNWASPKFDGAYLPNSSTIDDKGFSAEYQVSWLGRSFDQLVDEKNASSIFSGVSWIVEVRDDEVASTEGTVASAFGVDFLVTADHYQKTKRSMKYGILFLTLTFGAFFLMEILFRLKLHPIQYLLIGSTLVIFYLLLISLTEHIPFSVAYLLSTLASSVVIGAYSLSVLKALRLALIPAGLLILLYAVLYLLLQSEDYALLAGSLFLFTVLATTMYLTRKIDWYSIDLDKDR